MEKKVWEIQVLSLPRIVKYCKKCGRKMEFICSEQFRINAQRKYLDIWLIYKCSECDTTWNAAVFSRISPQSVDAELLEGFHRNDPALVRRYAMDQGLLRGNGVETEPPRYSVVGDSFPPEEAVELEIKSKYPLPVKVSAVIRGKLHISQKEYAQMLIDGKIESVPPQDLRKCRLKNGVSLIFNVEDGHQPAQ